jgi:hypothetical protein
MRVLMSLLLLGCVLSIVSAITGIQAFEADSHTGTVVTYWPGSWRWLALIYAAICGVAFYGIYRRYPIVWKIGFALLCFSAADFIFEAWWMLLPQPQGWVGAVAVTLFLPLVALYWGRWWWRQKPYFFPHADEQT